MELAKIVDADIRLLRNVYRPSKGDAKCITYGHISRLASWHLRAHWDKNAPFGSKFAKIMAWIESHVPAKQVIGLLNDWTAEPENAELGLLGEFVEPYTQGNELVSF